MDAVIGIDVGTGSARAGIFDLEGGKLAAAAIEIKTWRPSSGYAQQSSENIWCAVCTAVRNAVASLHDDNIKIIGIGFDGTCSLVVAGEDGSGLSVDPSGEKGQDVILWADHRATIEAEDINRARHEVLKYVGDVISPEMQIPKLLWLKRNLPGVYASARHFFDLPDYLTWRATGVDSRSECSTTCKWTYLAHEAQWCPAFFEQIGLGDLAREGFRRIGTDARPIGGRIENGLSATAAHELGLAEALPVGVSVIDAHAGGIGLFGIALSSAQTQPRLNDSLALIAGTSSCHMAVSQEPRFIKGVWGPYFQAMLPGMWLTEAGQSSVGATIDHLIKTHPANATLQAQAEQSQTDIYTYLNEVVAAMTHEAVGISITRDLHVMPDFNGNRSPHADPLSRGVIYGLPLSSTLEELARLYAATLEGLAYGTRNIIDALNAHGYAIDTIIATGGGTKNALFLQTHADATGCKIILPQEPDSVLLGAAVLGAVASERYATLEEAMRAMTRQGDTVLPSPMVATFHDAKYEVFNRIYASQVDFRNVMMRSTSTHRT